MGARKAEKCPESFLPLPWFLCAAEWREQDYQQAEVLRGELTPPERSIRGQSWHLRSLPDRKSRGELRSAGAGRPLTHKRYGTMSHQLDTTHWTGFLTSTLWTLGPDDSTEEGCPVIVGYAAACLALPSGCQQPHCCDHQLCLHHCRLRTATPNQSIGLERRGGRDPKNWASIPGAVVSRWDPTAWGN